jgi:hypothetical protein
MANAMVQPHVGCNATLASFPDLRPGQSVKSLRRSFGVQAANAVPEKMAYLLGFWF